MIIHQIDFGPVIEVLKKEKPLVAAYLHGSVLTDAFRSNSDVDLALLYCPGAHWNGMKKLRLAAKLGRLIHREVHLGLLSHRNLIFAGQVMQSGRILFLRDRYRHDLFRLTTYSMYGRLRDDLREVYNEYRA